LAKANLKDYFDAIVCGDDVVNSKPNPEIFLKAAKKINVNPKNQNKIYTKLEKLKFNGLTRKLLRVLLNEFDHKEIFNYCLEIYY
ncbi:hypothetical protein BGU85_26870, partial [Clostridioides difficile]|uniref:HAD-IA family hydrolase n=1 Tax=Clostridioides difficile TaxID=1496 RepID=UPI000BDBD107